MAIAEAIKLGLLFETDETAWLEVMAELAAAGRSDQMDLSNLSEFLADMAKRDRREVFSRLVVLLTHLLKADHQPSHISGSWRTTIREQRRELSQIFESKTLRNHAEAVLAETYAEARRDAADETGLDLSLFPIQNDRDLDAILGEPDA